MKKILLLLIAILSSLIITTSVYAEDDFVNINIGAGTILRTISQQALSSETNKIGDSVRFINLFDYQYKDLICLPKNAIFVGNITNIERNRFGRNALMVVQLNKLILQNGHSIDIDCVVITKGNKYIGGEYTKKTDYRLVAHSIERLGLVAQNAPCGPAGMGRIINLPVGEEFNILLQKPIIYKKYTDI